MARIRGRALFRGRLGLGVGQGEGPSPTPNQVATATPIPNLPLTRWLHETYGTVVELYFAHGLRQSSLT